MKKLNLIYILPLFFLMSETTQAQAWAFVDGYRDANTKLAPNIISMTELAKVNHIKVALSSVFPAFGYPRKPGIEPAEKIAALNRMIKNYANNSGIIYLDYYLSMVDERKGLESELTADGVHPNKAGYKIMAPLAGKSIIKALNQI